ncbi:TonB-dependent receptor domain-containing protein [Phenylobacterium sp.]|uniref:TonB-dependent receptor n=1 Tax=Phenylobacterium sp. TaxID=1871053 RepID=UPI002811CB44|nr:TonB-dependent receptor [Phenylobacterium sp.]
MLSCALASTAFAGSAFAQTAPSNTIEELVVTAEKREQSLQDVPVAVSAYTDERRELVGINSVQDLTNFTPGLAYSTNNDRINMRGIGRFTNNRSSEGGVAMYSDGFYTSSVTQFAKSTLFIDRTEVLRGPQGTLYGRNSIGGAMNIISKRPTDEFEAEVRAGLGNYDTWFTEAMISGPLFGNIQGRLAGTYSSQGEGYFTNLNPNGKDEGGIGDQWQVEAQLQGELGDGKLEWWVRGETVEWHNLGRGPGGRTTAQYGLRDITTIGSRAALTPNAANYGMPDTNLPANLCQMCFNTDDGNYINLESNTYVANVTLHLDSFDIKYITGLTYYDYRLQTDLDGTSRQAPFQLPYLAQGAPVPQPAGTELYYPRQHNQYQEEVWWFSNELNLASTWDGPFQMILGLYQFREGSNYTLSDARFPDDPRFETPTTQAGAPMAANPLRRYAYGSSENVSESYAVFGQAEYALTEQLKVTAGLRYTRDEKKSFESARLFCLYTASCPITRLTNRPVDITDAAAPGFAVVNGVRVYDPSVVGDLVYTDPTTGLRHRQLKNKWSGVTGTLGIDWQPDPDTLAYAKYTRGYKAGGFNSGTTTLAPNVTTEEETIDAYEVGLKKTFGGNFQANASAYYYDYQDIQIPITGRDPVTDLNVTRFFNMPKARIVGFELETIWQPIDNLQILANYSYLNAELREACCFQDPEDPLARVEGATPSGAGGVQDLKGQKLPSSTPHRFTVNVNYTWEFDVGSLSASLTHVWKDDTYYSIFNRYYNEGKAWNQTDARLLFNDADDRFTVIGYVKNIFKQEGIAGADGSRITTGPNTGFVNRTISYVPPRTYGVELQYRF